MHKKGLVVLLSTLASSRVAAAESLPRGVGPECKWFTVQINFSWTPLIPIDLQRANTCHYHDAMVSFGYQQIIMG